VVIDGTVLGKAVKHLGIRFPNAQIVKDLGYSKGVVSEYLNNKKLPSEQFIEAFENFYKIDLKSFIDSDVQKEPDAIWVNYERFKLVPLVTHRAQAGFLSGWGDDEYMEELPKVPWEVDKEYKGRYVTFEVAGDSMESDTNPRESIFEGDLLLCREVQRVHWKNKLHIHKWDFVIVHRRDGILVKRIIEHKTGNGALVLHSLNPYYDDFEVEMDDLIAIFNIVDIKRSARR
tara:strand:+ start:1989 stop:2681 length:693 start_codon:yes stop_codon:yes gene_type:complete